MYDMLYGIIYDIIIGLVHDILGTVTIINIILLKDIK